MLRKIVKVFILLMFICGIGMISYPSIANYINNKFAKATIEEYQEYIASSNEKKIQELTQEALDYNQSLPKSFPADPFSQDHISDLRKKGFKDFEMIQKNALIGYLEIPKIDVYLPIYYGTSEDVLNKGIGLIENTSLPVGGEGTHAVLAAHSGLPSQKLFTDLRMLEENDIFFVHVLNQHFAYQVNQIKVVLPTEVNDLMIEKNHDYVSLLTCTPYGINTHRLIVRGERIQYEFEKKDNTIDHNQDNTLLVIILIILSSCFVVYYKHRRG